MAPAATNPSDNTNPRGSDAAAPLRAMLVVAQPDRREQLSGTMARIAPHVRIEHVANVLDALLRSARQPADLLILDLAIDGAAAPALVRHLTRIAPSTAVLVFDDIAPMLPGFAYDVCPWSEAEAALQRWLERATSVTCRPTDRKRE